ncbi:hypothetical protein GCM10025760_30880 [Microbacterium yannicii]|uniref:Type II secretion system protein n=1 Tax=Microbacterium yannicii TaxID=671622 RepID=A0ABP9MNQ5_9MICO|nr:prepilin-type N-terminal cleavage/methylation domain-containing protein [Microbacterium yannicii]MCO5951567.1 prepilin-type N-terminal cleavage/methylation domain-containing protein [Microbacterium yannicii]
MVVPIAPRHPAPAGRGVDDGQQAGFSLVEMIVAMFLLAVLALAVLPLLIGVTRSGAVNEQVVAANALAAGRLATMRNAFPDDGDNACEGGAGSVRDSVQVDVPEPESGLLSAVHVGSCPPVFPGTVVVTSCVYEQDASPAADPASPCPRSNSLATLVTRVVVTS